MKYKIAGLSITSREIKMIVATSSNPVVPDTIPDIKFDKIDGGYSRKVHSSSDPKMLIDYLFEQVFKKFPDIMFLGVGCYGPFTEHEKIVIDSSFDLISYTTLGRTTGNRALSKVNLKQLIQDCIDRYSKNKIKFCIQTDVAVDTIGYIKQFNSSKLIKERTTALIRADYGVGGTFMHMSDKGAWHGVGHTEVGQINVQQWEKETALQNKTGVFQFAANLYSVEGLASIPAIEHYYQESFETLSAQRNHEVWDREAWYLAQLAWSFSCFVAPSNIVFCGIIMTVPGLLDKIRDEIEKITKARRVIPNHPAMQDSKYIDDFLNKEFEKEMYTQVKDTSLEGTLCLAALMSVSNEY